MIGQTLNASCLFEQCSNSFLQLSLRQSSRVTLSFLQLIPALFQRPTSLFITTTRHFSVMSTWTKLIAGGTTSNAPYTVRRNLERGCSFDFVILYASYQTQPHATNTANKPDAFVLSRSIPFHQPQSRSRVQRWSRS